MNACAYIRVSGASQLSGTGFDRQSDICQAWANLRGFALTETFREEAVSGTLDMEDRPAFQRLIAHMLDTRTKILVVESLDRLARTLQVQQQLILYIASKGIDLYAANTGENITEAVMSDPMRKAMVQIQGVFAELDKSMIVAKLRKGRERTKQKQGRCEGQKPYGHYPAEAPILARMRALRASGLYHHQIADALTSEGVTARNGGFWNGAIIARILRRQPSDTILALELRLDTTIPSTNLAA